MEGYSTNNMGAGEPGPYTALGLSNPNGSIALPAGSDFLAADFSRAGPDLLIHTPDGGAFVVPAYFMSEVPPALTMMDGAVLSGKLVTSLAGPQTAGMFAQAAVGQAAQQGGALGEPIGQVSEAEGLVTVTHPDGTQETMGTGGNIFQGDVVQTAAGSNVSIVFLDDTIFSLGESGRMVMDEMVYDPGTQTGAFNAQVVQGVFSFVSGQVAKTSPDGMVLTTPSATIGIRGSTGLVDLHNGKYALVDDVGGTVGELTITNAGGVVTLNQVGASTTVLGANSPPGQVIIMSPMELQQNFGSSLTKLVQVVAQKATVDANRAQEKAQETQAQAKQADAEAKQAEAEAKQVDAEAQQAEAEAAKAEAEAAAAKAEAEASNDPEAKAKAVAAEAKAAEAKAQAAEQAKAAAEAKAAAAEKAQVAAAKVADAQAATAKAEQAQQFSAVAKSAMTAQTQAFEAAKQADPKLAAAAEKAAQAATAAKAAAAAAKAEAEAKAQPNPAAAKAEADAAAKAAAEAAAKAAAEAAAKAAAEAEAAAKAAAEAAAKAAAEAAAKAAAAAAALAAAAAAAAAAEENNTPPPPVTYAATTPNYSTQFSGVTGITVTLGKYTNSAGNIEISATVSGSGVSDSYKNVTSFTASAGNDTIYLPGVKIGSLTVGTGNDSIYVNSTTHIGTLSNRPADTNYLMTSGTENYGNMNLSGTTLSGLFYVFLNEDHNSGTTTPNVTTTTLTLNSATSFTSGNSITFGSGTMYGVIQSDDGMNLSGVSLSNVSTIYLDVSSDTAGAKLTIDTSSSLSTAAVTGSGDDTIIFGTSGTYSFASNAVSGISTLAFNGTSANTLQVNQADIAGVTTITGNIGTDTITTADAVLNLSGATLSSIEHITTTNATGTAITGTNANETITGGSGADTLNGGLGNDTIDGGAGTDKAAYAGAMADYKLQFAANGTITTVDANTANGNEGTDTLTNIEALQFSDGTITVAHQAGERLVNTTTAGNQTVSNVTWLDDGGSIISWVDGNTSHLFMQRFDAAGTPVGSQTQLSSSVLADSWHKVTGFDNGGYAATWVNSSTIYTNLYNASGTQVGQTITVSTAAAGRPSIAQTNNGGFLVTYESADASGLGIYGRYYDSTGAAQTTPFIINATTNSDQYGAFSTQLNNGNTVVTWLSRQIDGNNIGVYARIVKLNGGSPQYVSAELLIDNSPTLWEQGHSLSALNDGGFVMAWVSGASLSVPGTFNVFAQRYDANGTAVGSKLTVGTINAITAYNGTSVTELENGGFVVTWVTEPTSGDFDVHGQIYNASGVAQGGSFVVNTTTAGNQSQPNLTATPDGGFIVSWTSTDASGYGIYSQRFDAAGNKLGYTTLTGDAGNNTFNIEPGTSLISVDGAAGTDSVVLGGTSSSTNMVKITNVETITGSAGRDLVMMGNTLNNSLNVDLGAGKDAVKLADGGNTNTFTNVEEIIGGTGNDNITIATTFAATDKAWFDGMGGVDTLTLTAGDDVFEAHNFETINGGVGTDTLASSWGIQLSGVTLNSVENVAVDTDNNESSGVALSSTTVFSTSTTITGTGGNDGLFSYDGMNLTNVSLNTISSIYLDADSATANTVGATLTVGSTTLTSAGSIQIVGSGDDYIQMGGTQLNLSTATLTGIAAIKGSAGNDTITGSAGNDVIDGGVGNDVIDGGAGTDKSNYLGVMADYQLKFAANGAITVVDVNTSNGNEGSDTLTNVETLQFSNGAITVATAAAEQRVNTVTTGNQTLPHMVNTADGGYVIYWVGPDASTNGIFAQKFDAAGLKVGSEFSVSTGAYDQSLYLHADVEPMMDGGFVVTWHSNLQDGSGWAAMARIYDASGNAVTGELQLNTFVTNEQAHPSITQLGNGNLVFAWQSQNQIGNGYEVYARTYSPTGTPLTGEVLINTTTSLNQFAPILVTLNNGGYAVFWLDGSSGNDDIKARFFDMNGTQTVPEFTVNTYLTGNQQYTKAAVLNNGNIVVTWSDISREGAGNGAGIYATILSSTGSIVKAEFMVPPDILYEQGISDVAALEGGGFVVTWHEQDGGTDYNVHAQIFDAAGSKIGGEIIINTTTTDSQYYAKVIAQYDGGFVVTWQSNAQDGSGWGIYSQQFDASGNIIGRTSLTGDASNNTFNIAAGQMGLVIDGGAGTDSLILNGTTSTTNTVKITNVETVTGSAGRDLVLMGNTLNNSLTIDLGAGKDAVKLADGGNTNTFTNVEEIIGGTGNDNVTIATTFAATDKAWFDGMGGADTLNLSAGDDVFEAHNFEIINGGAGTDTLASTWAINLIGVTLNGVENVTVDTDNNDSTGITLSSSTVFSTATTITGTGGNDGLSSNDGMNLTNVSLNTIGAIYIDADSATANTVGATLTVGSTTFINAGAIQVIGSGDDYIQLNGNQLDLSNATLTGIAAIKGSTNNDYITGSSGNDIIIGGAGSDTMLSGSGTDIFKYTATNDGGVAGDIIRDFTQGVDKLHFQASVFTGVVNTPTGSTLNANDFSTSSTLTSGTSFVYNTTNSTLYWDADGAGAAVGIAIAVLDNDANTGTPFTLAATDIVMI